jgi:hypothetical protein
MDQLQRHLVEMRQLWLFRKLQMARGTEEFRFVYRENLRQSSYFAATNMGFTVRGPTNLRAILKPISCCGTLLLSDKERSTSCAKWTIHGL